MSDVFKGSIKISDDVIASIAGAATVEVEGISGMSTGITGELYQFIGKKNPAKGVKIATEEEFVTVDVFVIVDYGVKINQVAGEVQQKIKTAIEEMTGLIIKSVNVHVQGIKIAKEEKVEDVVASSEDAKSEE